MARIDQAEIDRIKRECKVLDVARGYGTTFKERGNDEWIGLCPIHDDKNPSLCVNTRKNEWNCLGACKAGGDVIKFVMMKENVPFPKAVQMLQEGATGQVKQYGEKSMKLESPFKIEQSDQELLRTVVDFYGARLKQCPNGLAYLEKRGLVHPELIDTFNIGFVDRTLGYRLPPSIIKAGEEIRERLKELGVLRKKTGHEHLRGCIVFPLYDLDGNIVQMYGRRIDNGGKGDNPHFYMERPWGGIFNAPALKLYDEIIVCESIIDSLTFWVAGYRNVTASFGVNGFTDEMFEAIRNNNIKRILIAYDNDEAGNGAADALVKKLMAVGIDVFRVKVPAATKDVNAYACSLHMGLDKGQPGHAALGLAIRNAEWLGNGKTQPAITTQTPNFLQEARDKIASEQANVERLSSTVLEPEKPAPIQAVGERPEAVEKPVSKEEKPIVGEANNTAVTQASSLTPQASQQASLAPVASPMPTTTTAGIEAEIRDNEIVIQIGNRNYRVRGLTKNTFDTLKINLLVRKGEAFFVDSFDIYAARGRNQFVKEASRELALEEEILKRDLGKVLFKLEELQESFAKNMEEANHPKVPTMTEAEREAAMELLKSPNLIDRILADFDRCGVVGEETNKLVGYLAATSRKLLQPLAVLIQSSSAAGKSSLMDAVLAFMPHEDTIKYSAMTGQSLFYMGGITLKNRILAIAEEEGVEQAAYALKLLQSEQQLNIASTGKDPGSGRMETQEYHVEGPVMIFLTTTSDETDPELKNRCITLGVCEHACHTEAIHKQQRSKRTQQGRQLQHDRKAIRSLHQNAQRLIRPAMVINNYAEQLTFRTDKTKSRRAHDHYLTLIESVTLLHQYQRKEGTMTNEAGETVPCVETTLEDIAIANRLADQFLERSFAELPERTAVLLEQIMGGVKNLAEFQAIELGEVHFSRKDVRRWSTFGDTQLKQHLARLVDYEYLRIEPTPKDRGKTIVYSLSYDPASNPTMKDESGLIDVNRLRVAAPEEKSDLKSGPESSKVGAQADKVGPEKPESINENVDEVPKRNENGENEQKGAA